MADEFYKFPGRSDHGIRLSCDGKEPGIQAAVEGALRAMSDLCQGVYSYEDDVTCSVGVPGSLASGLAMCLEQTVIDCEMFRLLQRFIRGMEVSPEALALDLIAKVGPGGGFLSEEHTMRHLREEMWFPELWHRGPWDAWVASGRRSPLDIAHERVQQYLEEPLGPVLDDDRIRDVGRVVQEAERALLGPTTGILR
jgi:trimethylamine--corrinoid protein Co-methyltransferase